jgi:hypothetical protein
MEKLVRCVQVLGNRVRYFPEKIANNEAILKKFGFIKQPIEEIEVVPQKPFPTPEKIEKPATSETTSSEKVASSEKVSEPTKPATKPADKPAKASKTTPKTKSK